MNTKDIKNYKPKNQIRTKNSKGQTHGYQEWYVCPMELWIRTVCINGNYIGYNERHLDLITPKATTFYIR